MAAAEPTHSLTITQGDITLLPLKDGALVNPSNTGMILGSGVSGAIARRGGPYIQQTLHMKRSQLPDNRLKPGRAVDTEPGQLNCKRLIHVSIVGAKKINDRLISNCIRSAYKLAEELELSQIAFPALGTGVAGYPVKRFIERFWNISATELPRCKSIQEVYLCMHDEDDADKNSFEMACDYAEEHVEEFPERIAVEISESGFTGGVFG